MYFHALFWPAMLYTAGYKTPDGVFVHGFLTVNGEKMSKSKGTFISAGTYLNHLDPTYLRYYYACKLRGIEDIDLNLEDFCARVNSDLIGKIANLGSRGAQMLNKKLDGKTSEMTDRGKELLASAVSKADEIADLYENLNFAKAITVIRDIADETNRYFDEKAPWKLIKDDAIETKKILTDIINIFRVMSVYLKPILPEFTAKVEKLFKEPEYDWNSIHQTLLNHEIGPFEHLVTRVDPKKVEEMVEESKQ